MLLALLTFSSEPVKLILLKSVMGGGNGPGSYYFWIYLQIAFLLPFLWQFIVTASRQMQLIVFLVVSIGFEFVFSIIDLPDFIYRLLATRYIFLIFLAYNIWIKGSIILNFRTVTLSLISIGAVLFFEFTDLDLEPLFYTTGWKMHRWICYYYVATLMIFVFWYIYKAIEKVDWLINLALKIGKCSYEIYLMQMIVFVFVSIGRFEFISNPYMRVGTYMTFMIVLSHVLGIFFKEYIVDRLFLRTKSIVK